MSEGSTPLSDNWEVPLAHALEALLLLGLWLFLKVRLNDCQEDKLRWMARMQQQQQQKAKQWCILPTLICAEECSISVTVLEWARVDEQQMAACSQLKSRRVQTTCHGVVQIFKSKWDEWSGN